MFAKLKNLLWPRMKVRSESVHIQVESVDNSATAMLQLVVHAPHEVIDDLEIVLRNDVYSVLQRQSKVQRKDSSDPGSVSTDTTLHPEEGQLINEPHIFFPKVVQNGN